MASEKLGIGEEELDGRLRAVAALLPDLAPRLGTAPVDMVVALAGGTGTVAARLLRIKAAFPRVRSALRCAALCV